MGVSSAAGALAAEYGIEYVSPAFAIHREGRYGAILGHGFRDLAGYRALVDRAAAEGCRFIKLIASGLLTFRAWGELSCPGLEPEELRALVACAHDRGYPVMVHVNGADTVRAAVAAGADSVEHGYFMDEAALTALAASETVWVPTLAATAAFLDRPGFDRTVVETVVRRQMEAVRRGAALGVRIAAGSDSGASGVPHGAGIEREYRLLAQCGLADPALASGNAALRQRFHA